jgi:signal transduction histidine kinase
LARQLTDPKQQAAAQLVYEQSHRLSGIITDLMEFAKPQPPTVRECDVADLVGRGLRDAKARHVPVDRGIEVTVGEIPTVAVDEKQVSAALCEVIDNALHATGPAKGDAAKGDAAKGDVTGARQAGGHVSVHAGFDPYSGRVVLTVSDDGCGMDEATVKRAFDPFYSNQPAGRRRGLGLAKALRWVEASGGSIRLESRPGQGTRAIILLPAARSDSRTDASTPQDEPATERRAAQ